MKFTKVSAVAPEIVPLDPVRLSVNSPVALGNTQQEYETA